MLALVQVLQMAMWESEKCHFCKWLPSGWLGMNLTYLQEFTITHILSLLYRLGGQQALHSHLLHPPKKAVYIPVGQATLAQPVLGNSSCTFQSQSVCLRV